jgi:hypothetical protein
MRQTGKMDCWQLNEESGFGMRASAVNAVFRIAKNVLKEEKAER